MIHRSPDNKPAKGWFVGPWRSAVPVPVGYANAGVDDYFHFVIQAPFVPDDKISEAA